MKHRELHPRLWLALGVALVVISQFRYGVGALAWLAPIGWLRYLRLTQGWRSRLLFLGAMWLAWSVAVLKIVTGSIPPVMAVGFGLPIGSVFAAAMLTYEGLRRRIDANLATVGFASLMVVAEWSLHGLMPFGTWGAAPNTQLDQLALLQLASVTGLHGVSFLMYLVAGVLERGLAGEQRGHLRRWGWGLGLALLVVVSAGQARLASSSGRGVPTVTVAAVGTDSRVGTEPTLPDPAERSKVELGLVQRTTKAARAGAALVVWNEAAIMVTSDDEPAFMRRMGSLAADLNVDIVAAYVVPVQTEPVLYENKYIYLRADGEQDHTYLKHHPVPGEPAIPGTAPPCLQWNATACVSEAASATTTTSRNKPWATWASTWSPSPRPIGAASTPSTPRWPGCGPSRVAMASCAPHASASPLASTLRGACEAPRATTTARSASSWSTCPGRA